MAVWDAEEGYLARRRLVNLSEPFQAEEGTTRSGEVLIICTECDETELQFAQGCGDPAGKR